MVIASADGRMRSLASRTALIDPARSRIDHALRIEPAVSATRIFR